MNTNRFKLSSRDETKHLTDQNVIVGEAFAFLDTSALKASGLQWLFKLMGQSVTSKPHIVSLVGPESVELFGFTISPLKIEPLFLQCIISDKPLYRTEKDSINILVLNPLAPKSTSTVLLRSSGQTFSRHTLDLGANGEGILILRDLPVGEYDMVFEGQTESACQFIVAEYRMAPLVAALTASNMGADGKLHVTLNVESFGVPVNANLRLSLLERNQVKAMENVTAIDGKVTAAFALTGEGQHSINVQVSDEPTKTATVPLRGSRESERSQTVFSQLGTEVVGSLLPIGGKPVRGIYLAEGALNTSPIALDRVDDEKAHFTVNSEMSLLKVVVVDPTFPRPSESAVDVASATHPEQDPVYKQAEALFKQGQYLAAAVHFDERRSQFSNPHPYYAYWAACCHAKMGDREGAVKALKQSLCDGWVDMQHMANDDDLSALKNFEPFNQLLAGGLREISFENVTAGQKISIDVFEPVSLLLLGAFIDDKPWEGWTSVVVPSAVSTEIVVPEICAPGEKVSIEFKSSHSNTTVFAIVKDARLISTDTPELKLAAAIKTFVEKSGKGRTCGFEKRPLLHCLPSFSSGTRHSLASIGTLNRGSAEGSWGSAPDTVWGSANTWGMVGAMPPPPGGAMQFQGPDMDAAWDTPIQLKNGTITESDDQMSAVFGATPSQGAPPVPSAPMPAGSPRLQMRQSVESALSSAMAPVKEQPQKAVDSKQIKALNDLLDDPEVLFAGLVPSKDGKAILHVMLPDAFTDYVVECFAINGMNWTFKESKFRAAKDPFIQLTTPVFARADEKTQGFVHVGSTEKVRVKILLDGKAVEVFDENKNAFSGEMSGLPTAFTFTAVPGEFEAIVENMAGKVLARDTKRVDEPGKLKRLVRTIRLLEAGQALNLSDDARIRAFSLVPNIEKSFDVLVDATADYGHCCCEQTAAKLLSGCAMYMLASDGSGGGDSNRRKTAESVILAGIRREKQMWIKGKGFKSYPGGIDNPDQYYGRKAALYLWNLEQLKSISNDHALSKDLTEAIEEGLAMARDTTAAYGIQWPPTNFQSCQDAYAAVCFSESGTASSAIAFAEKFAADKALTQQQLQYLGVQVGMRTESAYAAATLLRSPNSAHMKIALDLANDVIGQFNEQGRMYSTVDSVAAIALMSELRNAGVTKGGGTIEMNGKIMSCADAIVSTEIIRSIKVTEGIATVIVDTMAEEDWTKFASEVPLRISLQNDGQHTRAFKAGDSLDLVVELEQGYKMGDLLWVALPDAISRVVGGGQVKLFSIDFAGKSQLRISLAATGVTDAFANSKNQSIAVCVRNMFIEERVGNPGLISISVTK
jgi:hypothetical protein